MKQIQQYIQESILDDEDDIMHDNDWIVEKFLKENYKFSGEYIIKNNIIDVNGDVFAGYDITQLLPKGYKFGTVKGDFYCDGSDNLVSLEGAPIHIIGSFDCSNCKLLTSLKGGPKEVDDDYICNNCEKLASLEGAPKKAYNFRCRYCPKLTDLKGAPQKTVKSFSCTGCTNLISLKGGPKTVGKSFYVKHCPKLTDLTGIPTKIAGNFYYSTGTDHYNFTKDEIAKLSNIQGEILFL